MARDRARVGGRGGVAGAAGLLAVLTAASQALGFVRDAVVAAVFGAGAALDAYLVSQGLMNLVLALIASAMARAIVPAVSRAAAAGEIEHANGITRSVLTLTGVVLVTGATTAWFAAEGLVAALAPGFDEPTRAVAVELSRIVLLAAVLVAGTDVLAAAAQAHGRFLFSGLQGIGFNVVMIGAALVGIEAGVTALAWGFVLASGVRLLLQLPPARAVGLRMRPRWDLGDPGVREVLRLVPALLLTAAAVNVNTLVDRAVGSAQGEGVITALSLGWRLVTLVDSLLVLTLLAALYPALGAASRQGGAAVGALTTRAARVVLVVVTPVVALLVLLAEPLVRLLFGRGDFDDADVGLTSLAVVGYAVAALALALRALGTRACLALGDTRTPVLVSLVVVVLNVLGDLTLGIAYGVVGLAAATTLSIAVGAFVVLVRLRRRHGAIDGRAVLVGLLRTSTAAALAVGLCLLVGAAPGSAGDVAAGSASAGEAAVSVLVCGAITAPAYVVGLWLLRSSELADTWTSLRGMLRPRGA